MSRLTGFLIHSSIPNFYFYNYDVYILQMHNIDVLPKFISDYAVMLPANSAPTGSITE